MFAGDDSQPRTTPKTLVAQETKATGSVKAATYLAFIKAAGG